MVRSQEGFLEEGQQEAMNFLSRTLLAILLVGSLVNSTTDGTTTRTQIVRKARQGPSEIGTLVKPLPLVKMRSTFNEKTLDERFPLNVFDGRRKRQAFRDVSGDPGLMFFHHLSEHGKFNQDTHSCEEVMSRPCKRPSDCHGCLGLFTCKMPQGRCDFKSVSKRTGMFYQSLQKDETSDVHTP